MTIACLLWLLWIIACDFRQRRVFNWLVLLGAALALIALASGHQPFGVGWVDAGIGAGVGFGVLLIFYALRLMGAGDVKFAGVLGLWVGLAPLLPIWIGASLLAMLHSVLWMALQRWPVAPRLALALSGKPPASSEGEVMRKRARHIPYAAYLAIAALAWMAWSRTP